MSSDPRPKVLVVADDPATGGLLGEWLADEADVVVARDAAATPGRYRLLIVEVGRMRAEPSATLQRAKRSHPGTPLIALSPTLFPAVARCGDVARQLGADMVLPLPLQENELLQAVRSLLEQTR
jgi:DNA-binding response OmpR family regulator